MAHVFFFISLVMNVCIFKPKVFPTTLFTHSFSIPMPRSSWRGSFPNVPICYIFLLHMVCVRCIYWKDGMINILVSCNRFHSYALHDICCIEIGWFKISYLLSKKI